MSDDTRKKHLVIGAGFCGLGVAAAFKRTGIPFDVLEADDDLGGNWYHGVYETVHIISSKKTTAYAEMPMPSSYPDFPSAAQMLAYLRGYAEMFGLREHITFNARVVHVEPETDAKDTWRVTFDKDGTQETRVYGGVVVCNGHHWDKRMPKYPGTFDGEILHSKDYKKPDVLAGKRVLVLGGGNSACDIAVEAARFAKSSHISMRRGYWFMPKTMFGVPSIEVIKPWMPIAAQRVMLKAMLRLIVGRYEDYGLQKPDHEPFEHHPTINSELLYYIRHGRITPHPDVKRWDGSVVEFVDGAREHFDLVVAATGFNLSFPFLSEGVVKWKDGMPQLYGGLVPPDHKNIYFFGISQPRYGAGPLISAGADVLCTMVATQERLKHPLGAVLEKMGQKPPKSSLQDPHQTLRQARVAKKILPKLEKLEPFLMRR